MGKRKLHNETYFQCDWTGIPMKSTNCFMPSWTPPSRVGDKIIGAKLIKHGSYSCWEAVVAHAALLHKEAPEKLQEIRGYINAIVGCTVEAAPDFTSLAWFSLVAPQFTTAELWMEKVTSDPSDIVAIRIPADGAVNYHEVECKSASIQEKFTDAFPMPVRAPQIAPQRFQLARRKGAKDRDISVFYVPDNNGMPLNATASSLFKMQIYGDALVVQLSKEPCFMTRERYINFTAEEFQDHFYSSKKRKEAPATLTPADYAAAKIEMETDLDAVEASVSAFASEPGDLAKAAVLPPACGKEISSLLKAQGKTPPKKAQTCAQETTPPQIVRQNAMPMPVA